MNYECEKYGINIMFLLGNAIFNIRRTVESA